MPVTDHSMSTAAASTSLNTPNKTTSSSTKTRFNKRTTRLSESTTRLTNLPLNNSNTCSPSSPSHSPSYSNSPCSSSPSPTSYLFRSHSHSPSLSPCRPSMKMNSSATDSPTKRPRSPFNSHSNNNSHHQYSNRLLSALSQQPQKFSTVSTTKSNNSKVKVARNLLAELDLLVDNQQENDVIVDEDSENNMNEGNIMTTTEAQAIKVDKQLREERLNDFVQRWNWDVVHDCPMKGAWVWESVMTPHSNTETSAATV